MKCLTVRQPWADYIFHGSKRCENRTWRTNHLGAMVIHAGSTPDNPRRELTDRQRAQMGHLLGIVWVTGYDREKKSLWDEPGEWHWRFSRVHAFREPIPFRRGRLGLFEIRDRAILDALREFEDGERDEDAPE